MYVCARMQAFSVCIRVCVYVCASLCVYVSICVYMYVFGEEGTYLLLGDALGTFTCGLFVQGHPQTVHSAALTGLELQPDVLELRDVTLTL